MKKIKTETPEEARAIPENGILMSGSMNWTFQV